VLKDYLLTKYEFRLYLKQKTLLAFLEKYFDFRNVKKNKGGVGLTRKIETDGLSTIQI